MTSIRLLDKRFGYTTVGIPPPPSAFVWLDIPRTLGAWEQLSLYRSALFNTNAILWILGYPICREEVCVG